MRKLVVVIVIACGFLSACGPLGTRPETTLRRASLEPATNLTDDLISLPRPKGRIPAAVYGFRDQTGQYKQAPDSSLSTAVSQGGASMLVKAMNDSGWFTAVEREGLQDLLTERKILRALDQPDDKSGVKGSVGPGTGAELPSLMPARVLLQGAIVGYDFNVSTGGLGVKYLGIGASEQYRKDQVTVNLRAIDTSNGRVLHSISTTKTIYSTQIQPGVYRFIGFRELLEAEAGYTYNEPIQLAIQEAIQQALLSVIVEGVVRRSWDLADNREMSNPVFQRTLAELNGRRIEVAERARAENERKQAEAEALDAQQRRARREQADRIVNAARMPAANADGSDDVEPTRPAPAAPTPAAAAPASAAPEAAPAPATSPAPRPAAAPRRRPTAAPAAQESFHSIDRGEP